MLDIGTIIGWVLSLIAIVGSILLAGDLMSFVDAPSVMCVVGGAVGATFVKWPIERVLNTLKIVMKCLFYKQNDPFATIEKIAQLAETARRESIFALEKVEIEDPFMKKAMTLAADNRPPEMIASILQLEIDTLSERHKNGHKVLEGMASDAPSLGMIGTLIGLVLMLKNMSDPTSIGPAMAVALITTFYGAVMAYVIVGPIKNILSVRTDEEVTKMNIVLAGTLAIVAGENPRLIKEKLYSYLAPATRPKDDLGEKGGAAGGAG